MSQRKKAFEDMMKKITKKKKKFSIKIHAPRSDLDKDWYGYVDDAMKRIQKKKAGK